MIARLQTDCSEGSPGAARRRAFTLVELLITVSIIAILATMVMFAMFSAQEAARRQKTKALITKLNDIIMQRYDEYRTRRVPITIPMGALLPAAIAQLRLNCDCRRFDAIGDAGPVERRVRPSDGGAQHPVGGGDRTRTAYAAVTGQSITMLSNSAMLPKKNSRARNVCT